MPRHRSLCTQFLIEFGAFAASVKERVAEAQESLTAIAKNQVELDSIRQEQNANYKKAKADLEAGIAGVEKALVVLRDYYSDGAAAMIQQGDWSMMQQPAKPVSHSKNTGGTSGIMAILALCESDFSKDLAGEAAAESDAQSLESCVQIRKESKQAC